MSENAARLLCSRTRTTILKFGGVLYVDAARLNSAFNQDVVKQLNLTDSRREKASKKRAEAIFYKGFFESNNGRLSGLIYPSPPDTLKTGTASIEWPPQMVDLENAWYK
jgi:hypothetical protein